jgi:hypothetical protein
MRDCASGNLEIPGSTLTRRPGMTCGCWNLSRSETEPAKILFTISVDWIFTSFIERRFTNVFLVTARFDLTACLYRACHAD